MPTKTRIAILSVALALGSLTFTPSADASPAGDHVVISEIYQGGGAYDDGAGTGSTYNRDFLELYNPSDTAADLSDLTVYYRVSGGVAEYTGIDGGHPLQSLAGAPPIPPHSHYLIALGESHHPEDGVPLPTPDWSLIDPTGPYSPNVEAFLLQGDSRPDFDTYCGQVEHYTDSSGNPLPTVSAYYCDWADDPQVIDTVGSGSGGYETAPTSAAGGYYTSLSRTEGQEDTDDNSADFLVEGVNPQNSTAAPRVAAGVGAADVTANYGTKVRLAVSLTPATGGPAPTGHVDLFNSDGSWLGDGEVGSSGVATYTAAAFTWTPGTYTLSYRYLGDANYTPSEGTLTLTVARDAATMSAQPATYSYGTPGEVDVTVTGQNGSIPTGEVTLADGSTPIASGSLQRGAAYIDVPGTALTIGQHSLTATYPGDHGVGAASTTVDVTVQKAATRLVLTPPSQQVKQGTAPTLTIDAVASGITPTGAVTIKDGTTALGTATLDDSGRATFTLPKTLAVRSHTIDVSYDGDGFTLPATQQASVSVVSARTTPRLTVTRTPGSVVVRSTRASLGVRVTATGGAAATGHVTVTVLGVKHSLTLRDGRATLRLPAFSHTGRYAVTIAYGGSTTLRAATTSTSITVVKGAPHLTVSVAPHKVVKKRTRARIAVHVTGAGGVAASGKVTLTVRGVGHTLVLHHGRATLRLATFPRAGRFTATLSYRGSTTLLTAKKTISLVVRS